VQRFLAGFVVASGLWAAAGAYLHLELGYGPPEPVELAAVPEESDAGVAEEEAPPPRRRRRRRRPPRGQDPVPASGETQDDDLREDEMRTLDLVGGPGGQERIPNAELNRVFDEAFPTVRRCLVLAASEEPVVGTLTFAVRIRPDGSVEGVRLTGPRPVRTGEAGDCMRRAARAMTFPSYDGPPMVARFPLELE
jgi:hypothetical protein